MAYGSLNYLNYYRFLYIQYFSIGMIVLLMWSGIQSQCRSVCPVASRADLALRVAYEDRTGLDNKYLLPGMPWPDINGSMRVHTARSRIDLEPGAAPMPYQYRTNGRDKNYFVGVYTDMFACNLTEALGSGWWNSSVSVAQQWQTATAAGSDNTSGYWGARRTFPWESTPSVCYVCCDPVYIDSHKRCRPSVTKVSPFMPCSDATQCEVSFVAAILSLCLHIISPLSVSHIHFYKVGLQTSF